MKSLGKVQGPEDIDKATQPRRLRLLNKLQQVAEKQNGTFLGVWRENNDTMGRFICAKGHAWTAYIHNIRRGEWCWKCGHNVHDDEQCRRLAEKRGGRCLRTWQERGETYGEFECGNGHPPWIATASRVIERTWCRMCAIEKTKGGIEWCKQYAKRMGGRCLSDTYINAVNKLHWRCAKGHEWWARWAYVNNSYWCSKCSRGRRIKNSKKNK
jgi:hypothetical protein